MNKPIAEESTATANVQVYSLGSKEVSIRIESSSGRLSYLDVLVEDLPVLMAALSAADLAATKAGA